MEKEQREKLAGLYAFWFGTAFGFPAKRYSDRWFAADPAFDGELRIRFNGLCEDVLGGRLPDHFDDIEHLGEAVALILAYDQLPRNLFRHDAKAFSGAGQALRLCMSLLDDEEKSYSKLRSFQQLFVLMPLMHSEEMEHQDRSLELFFNLWKGNSDTEQGVMFRHAFGAAEEHRSIIARFGRYPHRNRALGRESTPDELEFLRGAKSFGQ